LKLQHFRQLRNHFRVLVDPVEAHARNVALLFFPIPGRVVGDGGTDRGEYPANHVVDLQPLAQQRRARPQRCGVDAGVTAALVAHGGQRGIDVDRQVHDCPCCRVMAVGLRHQRPSGEQRSLIQLGHCFELGDVDRLAFLDDMTEPRRIELVIVGAGTPQQSRGMVWRRIAAQ